MGTALKGSLDLVRQGSLDPVREGRTHDGGLDREEGYDDQAVEAVH